MKRRFRVVAGIRWRVLAQRKIKFGCRGSTVGKATGD
jgi:hypothetical protein